MRFLYRSQAPKRVSLNFCSKGINFVLNSLVLEAGKYLLVNISESCCQENIEHEGRFSNHVEALPPRENMKAFMRILSLETFSDEIVSHRLLNSLICFRGHSIESVGSPMNLWFVINARKGDLNSKRRVVILGRTMADSFSFIGGFMYLVLVLGSPSCSASSSVVQA